MTTLIPLQTDRLTDRRTDNAKSRGAFETEKDSRYFIIQWSPCNNLCQLLHIHEFTDFDWPALRLDVK